MLTNSFRTNFVRCATFSLPRNSLRTHSHMRKLSANKIFETQNKPHHTGSIAISGNVLKQNGSDNKPISTIACLIAGLVLCLIIQGKACAQAQENEDWHMDNDAIELIDDNAYEEVIASRHYDNEYKLKLIERKSLKNISKGVILVAFAEGTSFFALDTKKLAEPAKQFSVVIIKLKGNENSHVLYQIADKVDEIAKKGQIKSLILVAHGDEKGIQLNHDWSIEITDMYPGSINCDSSLEILFDKLPLDANIILNCCNTGKGEKSLAYRMAQLANGRQVFAPTRTCYGLPELPIESGKIFPKFYTILPEKYESQYFVKESGKDESGYFHK